MDPSFSHDAQLFNQAYRDVAVGLKGFIKQLEKPKSIKDLIDMAAELRALAERFDSLNRGVLDLQGRACL